MTFMEIKFPAVMNFTLGSFAFQTDHSGSLRRLDPKATEESVVDWLADRWVGIIEASMRRNPESLHDILEKGQEGRIESCTDSDSENLPQYSDREIFKLGGFWEIPATRVTRPIILEMEPHAKSWPTQRTTMKALGETQSIRVTTQQAKHYWAG